MGLFAILGLFETVISTWMLTYYASFTVRIGTSCLLMAAQQKEEGHVQGHTQSITNMGSRSLSPLQIGKKFIIKTPLNDKNRKKVLFVQQLLCLSPHPCFPPTLCHTFLEQQILSPSLRIIAFLSFCFLVVFGAQEASSLKAPAITA